MLPLRHNYVTLILIIVLHLGQNYVTFSPNISLVSSTILPKQRQQPSCCHKDSSDQTTSPIRIFIVVFRYSWSNISITDEQIFLKIIVNVANEACEGWGKFQENWT